MNKIDIAYATLIVSRNTKLTNLKNYLFKYKYYTGWLSFLQFKLANLKVDPRLGAEEKIFVNKNKSLINRFRKSKRPAIYLKNKISLFTPLIKIVLKYEQ